MKPEIKILSWLLHHGNRAGKDEHFYKIKIRFLAKYGKIVCYDVQFIEGKKCWSCDGKGNYPKFYHNTWHHELCWHCYNGWYKRPTWNILARIKFGRYEFHRPMNSVYEKPVLEATKTIEGYIDHNESKYTEFAKFILFLFFEKGYLKRWWKETGNGWRLYWYWPRNWINCTVHILKKGFKAYPFKQLRIRFLKLKHRIIPVKISHEIEELPF